MSASAIEATRRLVDRQKETLIDNAAVVISALAVLISAFSLLTKSSLGFLKDFASWVDFLAGAVFLLSIIVSIPSFISIIFGLLLLQSSIDLHSG